MHTKYEAAKRSLLHFKQQKTSRCSLSPKLHTQVKENVAQINGTFFVFLEDTLRRE